MKNRVLIALAVVAAGLGVGVVSSQRTLQAAPAPSVVPITWELTFKQQAPERLIMTLPGKSEPQTLWFFRYTVTNETGKDVLFTPEFQLLTDTGQIIASGKEGANDAFEAIKELYANSLMVSPIQVISKLLQGVDNAKDSVVIFANVDKDARVFKLEVSGISGETAEVENPLTHEKVILHKTLVVEYEIPGEAIGIDPHPQLKSTTWVMK